MTFGPLDAYVKSREHSQGGRQQEQTKGAHDKQIQYHLGMSDFLSSIQSPWWWFSVVVVGIVVNLISAYVKPGLDHWMAGHSTARKARLKKDESERSARIEKMKLSDRALFLAARREHGWLLWAIFLFSLSAVILLTGNVIKFPLIVAIANLLAIILMFLGIDSLRRAIAKGSEIDDATR